MTPDPETIRTVRGLMCGGVLSLALWVPVIVLVVVFA